AMNFPLVTADVQIRIQRAVARMVQAYGPQGWWPVRTECRGFKQPQGERELRGYHPGEFAFPATRKGRWEIVCGAVLTQNTAWLNVERALDGLRVAKLTTPEALIRSDSTVVGSAIRPAGYFNQKSKYLVAAARWFIAQERSLCRATPSRALLEAIRPGLLEVLGVGPETADSILLYAFQLPTFVVDAYTRKVFGRIGVVQAGFGYERIRHLFETALARHDTRRTVCEWQEAHAVIVEHAKRYHGRGADPTTDFLLDV
ncbi:MAG TPA: hypothetical protein VKP30_11830, partial [Polyangiaceae bacterium]|nr:hypothetical protein [Polyangiaceae bacterium]